jgi:hypothetical protein
METEWQRLLKELYEHYAMFYGDKGSIGLRYWRYYTAKLLTRIHSYVTVDIPVQSTYICLFTSFRN